MRLGADVVGQIADVQERIGVNQKNAGDMLGAVAANQAALFVTLRLLNGPNGEVSAYTYAFIFFQLPHGLFAVSIMTTTTPAMPPPFVFRPEQLQRLRPAIHSLLARQWAAKLNLLARCMAAATLW
jgi:peptidoglycan biosynthesis protein MviN/MurJ (putative lipid II flippase)